MKHKLYNRLLSLALALGLVVGMLPGMTFAGAAEPNARSTTAPEVSFELPVQLFSDNGTNLNDLLERKITIPISSGNSVDLDNVVEENGIGSLQNTAGTTYTYTNAAAAVNGTAIPTLTAREISSAQTGAVDGEIRNEGSDTQYKTVTRTVTHYVGVWYGNQPSQINASNVLAYKTYTETYQIEQKRERHSIFGFTWWGDWEDVSGTRTQSNYSGASDQQSTDTVYFMYESSGEVETDRELSRRKYVSDNGDGTYDLTLTVSGAAGSITNKQKLDVVFIVDKSGSMNWDMNHNDGDRWNEDPDADDTPRLTAVKNAIKQIASELDSSETIDARYSLVSFSGSMSGWYEDRYTYNDATVNQTWTDSLNTFTNQLNRISADGGTNYEAGLYSANQELLDSTRPGAMTAVIFLSDGEPTYYYDRDGYTTGSGSSYSQQAMDDAKAEAAKMAVDFFYAIGVGDSYDEQDRDYADTLMPVYMQNLVSGATQAKSTQFFDGNNSDALNNIFDQISGDITSLLCTDVTITDTLTSYVEMVSQDGDGTVSDDDLYIEVLNGDDQTVASGQGSVTVGEATITASYDAEMKRIVLDFPDDYQLTAGYTYKVTAKIQATEAAYEYYRANGGQYIDTGAPGTGETSADQGGIPTNSVANVTYTYNGVEGSSIYPVPVIQLNPKTLTIEKTITGLDELTEEQMQVVEEGTTFTVTLNNVSTDYTLDQFKEGENGVYTLSIPNLSPNTAYEVSETAADLSPTYTLQTTTPENSTGTLTNGTGTIVSFTNAYTLAVGDLTINKTVTGLDEEALAELKGEISFKVENEAGEVVATIDETTMSTPDDPNGWENLWKGSNFTYTVPNLLTGDYTVTETGYDDLENYQWTGGEGEDSQTVSVTTGESAEASFENNYESKTAALTIKKEISGELFGDGRDDFSFKIISKDDGTVYYVHINGAGSENITLPTGEYTVIELDNQNYECTDNEQTVNLTSNGATVTFTNTRNDTKIPSDSGATQNNPSWGTGDVITWNKNENDEGDGIRPDGEQPTPEN